MKKAIKKLFGYQSTDPQIFLITTKHTTAHGTIINGQIATDVIGLTFLEKWPRVIVFLGKDKYTAELILQSKVFAIHLLSRNQLELVKTFGLYSGYKKNKFNHLKHGERATGSPIIPNCIGYADCQVIDKIDLGDHTAVVGLIVDSQLMSDGNEIPLHVSYFLQHAPKMWLLRLALTTRKSRNAVKKSMEEWVKRKGLG